MLRLHKFFRRFGPGIITGSADDDPSGIVTYSQTGAQYGYAFLWLAFFTTPLMIAAQEMSARLGLVTRQGLATLVRKHVSFKIAVALSVLVFIVNTINLGADLGAMSEVTKLLVPGSSTLYIIGFGALILGLEIWLSYKRYANVLKWLTLALLTYVAAAFSVHQDWGTIFHDLVLPTWVGGQASIMLVVAILGTTISPYLFFWQASEEVEEEKHRPWDFLKIKQDVKQMRRDTYTGMIYSNLMMFFIIITTAATLHRAGITTIDTAQQAAEAIRPIAGQFTFLLFALGIIGNGLMSVPILAGAAAYAVSDVFQWREGLTKRFRKAPAFYLTIIASVAIGAASNFFGWSPIKFLIAAAVLNGLLAPVLLWFIIRLADRRDVVGKFTSPPLIRWAGWLSWLAMTVVGLTLIWQWIA